MAVSIRHMAPVAHVPLGLGVLGKLHVAQLLDTLIPANPAHVRSCGRGVAALVVASLDGHHVLYTGGRRLDERGMLALLQPGLTPHSVHDTRLGQVLDALCAANLHRVFGAIALNTLETYAIETPWMHQDTTTIALYGAYEEVAQDPAVPRPSYGHSQAGRGDLTQGLLSLGGSGDGGLPRRMGLRAGNTRDSLEVPCAIADSLALGLDGGKGIGADSKASSQRTLGLCLEQQVGLVTLVPRTCTIRQEGEEWGRHQASLPRFIDKPGRTRQEPPRRWYGRSVTRAVAGEYCDRIAEAPGRFVAGYATQLAEQHGQTYGQAQSREAEDLAEHIAQVEGRPFAWAPDAEAAIAAYEGRVAGKRGRPVRRWRYHDVHSRVQAQWQRQQRVRRGRPRKGEAPQEVRGYRLVVEAKALVPPVEPVGWTVLATTVSEQTCGDPEIVRAYREQTTTVEPGLRWIKHPAAMSPVWLEKPQRLAALAMLTVVGLLVYGLIQRQVRQYLPPPPQSIPGNQGDTAMPTATGVLSSFAQVTLVHLELDGRAIRQGHGWQEPHRLLCQALGVDDCWYEGSAVQKNNLTRRRAP